MTVIDAGSRSGREWKCWTPLEPAGTIGSFIGLIVPNGIAMPKWKLPLVPFITFSPVVTVTVSPAVNGVLGMKLPPCPSESASIVPLCAPDARPDHGDVADLARGDAPERDLGLGQRAVRARAREHRHRRLRERGRRNGEQRRRRHQRDHDPLRDPRPPSGPQLSRNLLQPIMETRDDLKRCAAQASLRSVRIRSQPDHSRGRSTYLSGRDAIRLGRCTTEPPSPSRSRATARSRFAASPSSAATRRCPCSETHRSTATRALNAASSNDARSSRGPGR